MIFRTKYGEKNPRNSNPGSPVKDEFQLVFKEDGSQELIKVGQTNVKEFIQSHRDSVDYRLILERFQATQDPGLLDRAKGFYADMSGMNMNLQEFMNLNQRGKDLFEKLPVEVKHAFNNDYIQFLADPERLVNMMSNQDSSDVDEKVEEKKVTDDNQEQ